MVWWWTWHCWVITGDPAGLLQVKWFYVSVKCIWIPRCFSELLLNLKSCTTAQDQKQSSSAIMPYLGIKPQERIRAGEKWVEKESRAELKIICQRIRHRAAFSPLPSSASNSVLPACLLEDKVQNLSFYCHSTDPSLHFLVLFSNIPTLALLSSYAGHLFLRLTAKNIPSHP